MNPRKKSDEGNILNKDDRKLRQGYVDLKKSTIEELMELSERQNKLIHNRLFIEKLPDKGKKLIVFRDEVENEIKNRQSMYNSACQLLSNLTLNDSGSEDIEWGEVKSNIPDQYLDSDDEENISGCKVNPLKLIATHSGTHCSVINKSSASVNNSYANKMCKKFDAIAEPKERFKPNQLRKSSEHTVDNSDEGLKKKLGKKWSSMQEISPIYTINNTKSITLLESIKLQKEQAEILRETEKKQAAEKLMLNKSIIIGEKLPLNNIKDYRITKNYFDETASDEENGGQSDSNNSDN